MAIAGKTGDVRCPICRSDDLDLVVSKRVYDTDFSVFQCRNGDCRHGFTHPLPSEQALEKMYAEDDLNAYQLDESALKAVDDFFSHLFSNYVPQGIRSPGTLLDVGAGIGTFMNAGRNHGWQVDGIEFNQKSVDLGRSLFKLDIVHGNFYKLEEHFPGKRYDLINMNHVFEHVLHPQEYMPYLSRFLKPNGCLLITVPNILSDDFKKSGARWSYIHIPAHISYFSRYSMDRMFADARVAGIRFTKVFQSSFNTPQQSEGEGLTSMYRLASKNPLAWLFGRR